MSNELMTGDELENLVEKLVQESGCPGASAAVQRGDEVVAGAGGFLNLRTRVEATPDSLFQIGSNTKIYNVTLLMQLVDEGKLDLDKPAIEFLPDFKLADAEATRQITVRHLITHTSGIDGGDYIEDFGRGADAVKLYVDSLADIGLVHPIGKFHSYCNAGTIVAGRIIEVLTGLPWVDALREKLLKPLELNETVSLPEEALLFRTAAGHKAADEKDAAPVLYETWSLPFGNAPAGSVINASARDLCAFGQFHLNKGVGANGVRVLSEESAMAMREIQFPELTGNEGGGGQGLGWMISKQGPFEVIAHGGGTLGQVSSWMNLPEQGVSVAVLTNGPGGGAVIGGVTKEVLSRLGGESFAAEVAKKQAEAAKQEAPAEKPEPVDIDLEKYVGVYERKYLTTTVELVDGALQAQTVLGGYLGANMASPKPQTLKPIDANTFIALDEEGKPAGGAKFSDLDAEGRPEYLIMGRVSRRVS